MKAGQRVTSIEELCRLLRRSRLLADEEILALVQRWRSETGGSANTPTSLETFARWLVAGRFLTDYQMTTLLNGHADHFFIAGWKLLDRIGKGRRTRVYKGIDRVGQLAAIKVLPPSRARDPQALAHFQREARVGQRLDHIHVVRILGVGEEDKLHHIVMEYLEGETLQQFLDSHGRLEVHAAVDLALQALEGLQHLHERGVVHRDIEPSNLMLVRPAAARPGVLADLPLVKLLGFDVSRAEGEYDPLPEILDFSRSAPPGPVFPAPAYLAPELARTPRTADIRADLYSLGCVLYHALAGQPPFTDTSLEGLVRRHSTETPRPLRGMNPEVPDALARIIAAMIGRDPVDRFASPADAAEVLRTFLAADTVTTVQVEAIEWSVEPAHASAPPVPPPPPPFGSDKERSTVFSPFELDSPDEEFEPVAKGASAARRAEHAIRLDRRDWLLLAAGAAGLLVIQALGWLLGRLIGGRRKRRESAEQ